VHDSPSYYNSSSRRVSAGGSLSYGAAPQSSLLTGDYERKLREQRKRDIVSRIGELDRKLSPKRTTIEPPSTEFVGSRS
jgi:hypothetical protein